MASTPNNPKINPYSLSHPSFKKEKEYYVFQKERRFLPYGSLFPLKCEWFLVLHFQKFCGIMFSMSNANEEFTLESHVAKVVADSKMDHNLIAQVIRTSTVPLDSIHRILEENSWVDKSVIDEILGNLVGWSEGNASPVPCVHDADELDVLYRELGLTTEDMDARYEYHMECADSTVEPKPDETNDFYVLEELGFLGFENFVISRTSQPLFIVSRDSEDSDPVIRGKSSVNAIIVCPKELLDLEADDSADVWKPAGVTVTPSLAGGACYTFNGDFAVLNAYACDVIGLPYSEGDLAMIPLDVPFENLVVQDPNSGISVPLFMPLS